MLRTICNYFLIFIIYSVGGWIMESLLYIIRDRHVVKRGFLYGPLCPIYGCAAIICTLIFYGRVNNIFLLFVLGALVCGALEYITHFILEKLFNAMWWDYSGRRFNLNGRIYLNGVLIFGVGVVLIVKVLQPFMFDFIYSISDSEMLGICFIIYSVLLFDFAVTLAKLADLVKKMHDFQETIGETLQEGIDEGQKKANEAAEKIRNSKAFNEAARMLSITRVVLHIKPPTGETRKKVKMFIDVIADRPVKEGRTDIKLYGDVDKTDEEKEEESKQSE